MTPPRTLFSLIFVLFSASIAAQDSQSVIYAAPDQLDLYWTPLVKKAAKYPRAAMRRNQQGCVALSYIIEHDGRTSSHTPLAMMPDSVFAKAAIKAAKKFRYAPTKQNSDGEPVLTFTTFTFFLGDDRDEQEIRQMQLDVACTEAALAKIDELNQPD